MLQKYVYWIFSRIIRYNLSETNMWWFLQKQVYWILIGIIGRAYSIYYILSETNIWMILLRQIYWILVGIIGRAYCLCFMFCPKANSWMIVTKTGLFGIWLVLILGEHIANASLTFLHILVTCLFGVWIGFSGLFQSYAY